MQPLLRLTLLTGVGLLSATTSSAQDLMVCRHTPARVELYSATDGSLLNPALVDVDALLGLGGTTNFLWDALIAPNGEIWISNFSAQAVQRFSADGSSYLGDLASAFGSSAGLLLDGTTLGAGSPTSGAYSYDTVTMTQTQLIVDTTVWDVTLLGSDWLVSRSNGTVSRLDVATGTETPFATPGGFCEQAIVTPSGQVKVANFNLQGYTVHDSSGTLVQTWTPVGVGSIRGLAELANGNMLLSGSAGVFTFDPATGTVTTLDTGSAAFASTAGQGGGLGDPFCSPVANSTGATGTLAAIGSPVASTNNVELQASDLPRNAFGFFIVSRMQGLTPGPGGSTGNLCLGGSIGRYVGPGQIQFTGMQGAFSLALDLGAVPQPNGLVAVQPGETWNFQGWHRDTDQGQPTSNFTNGVEISFQ